MTTTAERLRIALEARSMKQSELALRTGIGKSSISTYLTGAYLPKQRNIYKMAHALDVNEAWLMGLDVPMERAETVAPETVIPAGFDPMPDEAKAPGFDSRRLHSVGESLSFKGSPFFLVISTVCGFV